MMLCYLKGICMMENPGSKQDSILYVHTATTTQSEGLPASWKRTATLRPETMLEAAIALEVGTLSSQTLRLPAIWMVAR